MRGGTWVLVALAAGLAAGALIAWSGDAALLRAADAVAPVGALWVNAIRMTVIPLVVSLLVTGIASAADLRAIGRLGARTLAVFVLLIAGMAALAMPLAVAAFRLLPRGLAARPSLPPGAVEAAAEVAGGGEATGLAAWLPSLLPPNPVAAAASGAMMPLVVFTLLFALAVARSPAAARATLLAFFGALGEAMLVLVRWVVAAAPLGVFALVLPLAARGAGLIGAFAFYVVVYSLASVLATLALYPVAAAGGRVPLRTFARAAFPAQTIAFGSSSSLASLPALVEGAERVLAMPARVRGFVLPLAASTFKVAAPVSWTIGALFVAWFYGVELHAGQLATIALAATFLSFAVPGVPRGAFLMLAPLFLAIGLPVEGIGILIAVDVVPDLFATVLNTTGHLTAAVLVARGQVDGEAAGDTGAASDGPPATGAAGE
jgi:Na+/H+-dicarboxylate symporter